MSVRPTNHGVELSLRLGLAHNVPDDVHLASQLLDCFLCLSLLCFYHTESLVGFAETQAQDLTLTLAPVGIGSCRLSSFWRHRLPSVQLCCVVAMVRLAHDDYMAKLLFFIVGTKVSCCLRHR